MNIADYMSSLPSYEEEEDYFWETEAQRTRYCFDGESLTRWEDDEGNVIPPEHMWGKLREAIALSRTNAVEIFQRHFVQSWVMSKNEYWLDQLDQIQKIAQAEGLDVPIIDIPNKRKLDLDTWSGIRSVLNVRDSNILIRLVRRSRAFAFGRKHEALTRILKALEGEDPYD